MKVTFITLLILSILGTVFFFTGLPFIHTIENEALAISPNMEMKYVRHLLGSPNFDGNINNMEDKNRYLPVDFTGNEKVIVYNYNGPLYKWRLKIYITVNQDNNTVKAIYYQ